ncbi:DUF374 domain-containing protein [Candidatus Kapabacteria bacterium]|nr:DUF374 domain-containing protein [Candidatus Kapabacteria bacterium]
MKQILLNLIISLIAKTWRIEINNFLTHKIALVGFWHGDMLPVWYFFRKQNPTAVVSLSKDGSLLSGLLKYWGFDLIRGSSSNGGKQVLEQISQKASERLILMTPDGPRGPIKEIKPGIVIASKRSTSPFYFINVDIKNAKIFTRSWDQFKLPKPFTKIKLSLSEPMYIKSDLSREEISKLIVDMNQKYGGN